ncbi:Mu transposase C-terminal domain-containing protein [Ideonella dechloratans]|uniref:Mu transposase C-terminal domain-containing protein n=1 Tax=Ideonella dechloratans TaxID=36863 RepID=UPI0035B0B245
MSPSQPKTQAPVLYVAKGATVTHMGREYQVLRVVDLNQVLAREPSSNEKVLLQIGTLEAPARLTPTRANHTERDLEAVSQEDWEIAENRLTLLEPLLSPRRDRSREDYRRVGEEAGVSVATIYRWVADYRATEALSVLLPIRRSGGRGKSRLSPEVLLILQEYIKGKFLTLQKPTPAAAAREIRRLCSNAKIEPLPAATTIYRHLDWISEQVKLKRREGVKVAREKYAVHKNPVPNAEWPLAHVQMDHTLLPVMIVDDEHRLPIARSWITLAIDSFSRVCLGLYLSLDSPSAMSAGMCVSHAILPKESWMARLGCGDIEWPFYGAMDILQMDNAREFRGNMLRVAAKEYHIDLHLRPVKVPHYGAYIERLMGTVSEGLKTMAGATFSDPKEKGVYDAEGNACLTIDELEKWLVLFFSRYHRDIHTGIGTTPLAKWREGILGTKTQPGRGLPARRSDTEKLRIDFMPFEERTVQDYGVVLDGLHYFHDVLRPWMNTQDPEEPKLKRKFRFRYDPRDISVLYFFDPNAGRYFAIPYRDTSLPPVSMWEFRAARKQAADLGMTHYDERALFELINRQRAIEEDSAVKTKAARTARQKRVQHAKARKATKADLPTVSGVVPTQAPPVLNGYDPAKIRPLDDDE